MLVTGKMAQLFVVIAEGFQQAQSVGVPVGGEAVFGLGLVAADDILVDGRIVLLQIGLEPQLQLAQSVVHSMFR